MDFRQGSIVTESSRTIRALARQALSGKWIEAVLVMLVVYALSNVPVSFFYNILGQRLGIIANIYSILISGPLSMGSVWYLIRLFRQQPCGVGDIGIGFRYAGKAIALNIVMAVKIILWSLLFVIPGIIAAFRYSQAFFVLADDPDKDIMQCIAESSALMRGNKLKYFILGLTFIGWGILASLPTIMIESAAIAEISSGYMHMDPSEYYGLVSESVSSPMYLIASLPTVILAAYMNTAYAAFYDLANGNLSVDSYDRASARGTVENPYTGEDTPFRDVPAEEAPQEFADPELKEAEDRYSQGDE